MLTAIQPVADLGEQTPYSCPSCGGPLWEVENEDEPPRFRCHTGHAFTATALLAGEASKIEESLWVTLRMLEERRHLLLRLSHKEEGLWGKRYYADQARQAAANIKRVRQMLFAPGTP